MDEVFVMTSQTRATSYIVMSLMAAKGVVVLTGIFLLRGCA